VAFGLGFRFRYRYSFICQGTSSWTQRKNLFELWTTTGYFTCCVFR